jgi:hypothetical protein
MRRALLCLLLGCSSGSAAITDAREPDAREASGDVPADARADASDAPGSDAGDAPAADAAADRAIDAARDGAGSDDASEAGPFVPGRCVPGGACLANDFCNYCDAPGTSFSCRCMQGAWMCTTTPAPCGVACGGGRCLATELCVGTSVAGGIPGPPPTVSYTCKTPPPACGTGGALPCACGATALCGLPCACRDTAPATVRCECAAP